ncbi:MAG: substrate-binding domain-containing protein [Candidatus Margulisbacteria bacterium]|jgi:phosphate transport system substrate-binding protein|nr:substrate-binding domain-containing protein [Candidatus Margulisiibacteriota bacterium]
MRMSTAKFFLPVFLLLACPLFGGLDKAEDALPKVYEHHPEDQLSLGFWETYSWADKYYKAGISLNSSLKITKDRPKLHAALAFLGLEEVLVAAVYEEGGNQPHYLHDASVRCGTSPEAYSALLSGNADIIFCFEPSDAQLKQARELGVSYKLTPLGKDAFVFFVNKQNPVRNLSSKQIQDIYSGKITNWRLVGGRDAAIRAFQRPKNSGSQTILEKVMNGIPLITPPTENYHVSMWDIIEAAANYRNAENALGYSFLYYASAMVRNEQIKLLSFDGIAPTRENIQNETYPFTETFYAITIEGRETENTKKLLQWLSSAEGQKLVELSGYTSYKPAE